MKKGFTLIELLIVIAILGILVALILPRFGDVRQDANTKVCISNLRAICSAMGTYETKENKTVTWTGLDSGDLQAWGYFATAPYCPTDTATTKSDYPLADESGSNPDRATCPKSVSGHTYP